MHADTYNLSLRLQDGETAYALATAQVQTVMDAYAEQEQVCVCGRASMCVRVCMCSYVYVDTSVRVCVSVCV